MLNSLSIKNYALIDDLKVEFNTGLSSITGETGAGKSILLGALGLVLGNRADLSTLRDPSKKCVIEAQFKINSYALQTFFEQNDLDYEHLTIIRREILSSGKSRAFINDTPVNLASLKLLGDNLIDIHSQNETLELSEDYFQFQVLDKLAGNDELLNTYSNELKRYKSQVAALERLQLKQQEVNKSHEYNMFLLEDLKKVPLKNIDFDELEDEYNTLSNIEVLKEHLSSAHAILSHEENGVLILLTQAKLALQKVNAIANRYSFMFNRLESSTIEINDLFSEIETALESLELSPETLEKLSHTLQAVNSLYHKHSVNSIGELLQIQSKLEEEVNGVESIEDDILAMKKQLEQTKIAVKALTKELHDNRKKTIPILTSKLQLYLSDLGMPNASFNIKLDYQDAFFKHGSDSINFLFSANKGGQLNSLKKAASGGELSRIMLSIKAVLSNYTNLPSIIFDEIDTGVSGEIAVKMADIMKSMSANMQIITITHLPQIAAKGDVHYKVYKSIEAGKTFTHLSQLTEKERIIEIAQMLDGNKMSDSALQHAKQLLN